jgi:hypothetical protein
LTHRVYIDIDGVLLDKKQKLPQGAVRFVEFLVQHFDCYWLTTHCRSNINNAVIYLSKFYDTETIELLKTVKPTNWETLKTEAIDFNQKFYWLDDYPFESEMKILENRNVISSLIKVDLNETNELERLEKLLSSYQLLTSNVSK